MPKLLGIKRLNELDRIRKSLDNPFERLVEQLEEAPTNISVDAAFEFFIAARLVPNNAHLDTIKEYRYIQRVWRESYPGLMLHQLTGMHTLSMFPVFYEGSQTSPNRTAYGEDGKVYQLPVATSRVATIHKKLIAVLRFLVGMGMCPVYTLERIRLVPLPTEIAKHLAKPNRKKRIVSEEELNQVLGVIPGQAMQDMLRLMFYAGCRPADAFRMLPEHITRVSEDFWYYDPPVHKCSYIGNQRIIPFGPVCIAILKPHLALRREPGLVFRNGCGNKWTTETVRTKLRRAVKASGVRPFTMRDLRRAYVNRIAVTHGRAAAATMAGHTPSVSRDHYLRENLTLMASVAKETS